MGVVGCKNCSCNKDEPEQVNEEIVVDREKENELEKERLQKIKAEGGSYFKPNNEVLDGATIDGDNKSKELVSNKSASKITIEVNEDKLNINKHFDNKKIEEQDENDLDGEVEFDVKEKLKNTKGSKLITNEDAHQENEEVKKIELDNENQKDNNGGNNLEGELNGYDMTFKAGDLKNQMQIGDAQANPEGKGAEADISGVEGTTNKNGTISSGSPNKFEFLSESHQMEILQNHDNKPYVIDKIQFGIGNKEELSLEERKLYEEAEKNLNQFYPPEKTEAKQITKKLKKVSLKDILTKAKFKEISLNPDTLIFHGELKKLNNYEVNAQMPQMYTSRFCTLTPKTFRYFRSKEQYLTSQKPMCVVPLSQITRINFAKVKKNSKKADHLIMCNKLGITNKTKILESKLFDGLNASQLFSTPESNECLLIFTCTSEENLFRWYTLIDFFMETEKV